MTDRELLAAALASCGGHVETLADRLTRTPQAVWRWLRGGTIPAVVARKLERMVAEEK